MSQYRRHSNDLAKLRVGLSGAVPDPEDWGGRPLEYEIQEFITVLSDGVFRHGGLLVHGCHPSFTPRILDRARTYGAQYDRKVARFYLSSLFAHEADLPDLISRYDEVADLETVQQAGDGDASDPQVREASLTRLRQKLIGDMDVLVIVGGKHHTDSGFTPGTKQELDMAIGRGLPCFIVGGLGGMSTGLAASYPTNVLGNGLSFELNQELMSTTDLNRAAGIIINALRSLRGASQPMDATIKHLEFIQGVVNRMAGNSFLLKGWSITLVAALIALGTKDAQPEFVLLALLPALAFWILDGYFLRQERLFRKLYDKVWLASDNLDFSMDTREFARSQRAFESNADESVAGLWSTCFSRTLGGFHGAVLLTIGLIYALLKWGGPIAIWINSVLSA